MFEDFGWSESEFMEEVVARKNHNGQLSVVV
jgi:hypothetical protein